MCGVVPENLIMVLGSSGASSVIRRLGGYTDGLFFSGALCTVVDA
jgi:hypothetical protein